MTSSSFLTEDELAGLGFRSVGEHVLISRKASIYHPQAISLGDHVRVDDFSILSGGTGLELGRHVHIACYCGLFAGSGIVLEDFAGLSAHVLVYSQSDDYSGDSLTNPTVPDAFKPGLKRGRVVLRRHAIVGAHSTIMPGLVLEEGAAVGAHSLVTKPCAPWTIYFGVPARKLRARSRKALELEQTFERGT